MSCPLCRFCFVFEVKCCILRLCGNHTTSQYTYDDEGIWELGGSAADPPTPPPQFTVSHLRRARLLTLLVTSIKVPLWSGLLLTGLVWVWGPCSFSLLSFLQVFDVLTCTRVHQRTVNRSQGVSGYCTTRVGPRPPTVGMCLRCPPSRSSACRPCTG